MDLYSVIRELHEQKEKLDRTIAALETLRTGAGGGANEHLGGSRRGRKFMNENERLEVSQRMKRYWAQRRKS